MGVDELTGLPPDPECLHCYLPSIISAWLDLHANKAGADILAELAQVMGEMVASCVYGTDRERCVERILTGLSRIAFEHCQDVLRSKHAAG